MTSYQKPPIEKNHEYIWYILPKGVLVNTPFRLAQMLLDKLLLENLALKHVPTDEVHLKPALFKK